MFTLTRNLTLTESIIPKIESMIEVLKSSTVLRSKAVRDGDTFIQKETGGFEAKREHIEEELEHALTKYIELFC